MLEELEAIIQGILREQKLPLHEGKITETLLSRMAISFGCPFATYWEVNSATLQLAPAIVWKLPDAPAEALLNETKNRTLSMSQGTAGHVWRSRRPVWTTNLIRDMCLPRSLEADFAGLRAGIWFAVKTSDTVFGVIELLRDTLPPASEEMLVLVEYFGLSLGRFLAEHADAMILNAVEPAPIAVRRHGEHLN